MAAASCGLPASLDLSGLEGSGPTRTGGATGSGGSTRDRGTGSTGASGGSGRSGVAVMDGGASSDLPVTGTGGGGAVGGRGTGSTPGAIVRGSEPTEQSASTTGPYRVMRYSAGLADSLDYAGYVVDYPADATPPFAGVAVIPGFIEGRSAVGNWGPFLASHGFAVITVDPNLPLDTPPVRATALLAAIGSLKDEQSRTGSPLAGKMDLTRLAVMGHSMGGGATLQVANMYSMELKAAIPLAPWDIAGSYTMITVPIMVMAGESDAVAPVASHAMPFYESVPASTPKAYVEFAGGDHYVADDPSTNATSAVLGLSWLKVYVEGDTRYRPFIKTRAGLSRLLTSP
jgi:pimeloyl-ACP methyl ester carboxylesterase